MKITPIIDDTARDHLSRLMNMRTTLVRNPVRLGTSLTAPDLTGRQEAVLLALGLEPGPHECRGLAETLGLSKPAIVRAVDALEKTGLAARLLNQDDRRVTRYRLTPQGYSLLKRMAVLLSDAPSATPAEAA